ncbi:MAG: hypothetical protein ACI8X5_002211 [Planctomycetota bacterium]|jgi:hypothetical protein
MPAENPSLFRRIVGSLWFWGIAISCLWAMPLYKSLSLDFPDPVGGFDREAESFQLTTEGGEQVTVADLAGHLLVVRVLDLGTPQSSESDFTAYRVSRKRLRGLGSLVMNIALVQNGQPGTLSQFITEKTARRPNNLFLLDEEGATLLALCNSAGVAEASAFVLDRHGRLRGSYGPTEAEQNRMSQDLGSLANWAKSDPAIGEPVTP